MRQRVQMSRQTRSRLRYDSNLDDSSSDDSASDFDMPPKQSALAGPKDNNKKKKGPMAQLLADKTAVSRGRGDKRVLVSDSDSSDFETPKKLKQTVSVFKPVVERKESKKAAKKTVAATKDLQSLPVSTANDQIKSSQTPAKTTTELALARVSPVGVREFRAGDFVWVDGALFADASLRPFWPAKVISVISQDVITIAPFGDTPHRRLNASAKDLKLLRASHAVFSRHKMDGMGCGEYKQAFARAMERLYSAEEDGDSDIDLLPSVATAYRPLKYSPDRDDPSLAMSGSIPGMQSNSPSPPKLSHGSQTSVDLSRIEIGSVVLAYWAKDRAYHPAKVLEYRADKSQYRVMYWDTIQCWVQRRKIVTQDDPQFITVTVSESVYEQEEVDESFQDELLGLELDCIMSDLKLIFDGGDQECWRYEHFMAGGSRRRGLAQKVSSGPFSLDQYYFILRHLQASFCSEKSGESTAKKELGKRPQNQEAVAMVSSVLWPEAIVRLIERRECCTRQDAETRMMDSETAWVSELLAARQMRRIGQLSVNKQTYLQQHAASFPLDDI